MAKGFERPGERRGRGFEYPAHPDAPAIQKLGEIVSNLYLSTEESERTRLWASASRLLSKSKADKQRVAKIMLEKRVGALSKLVVDLEAAMHAPQASAAPASAGPESPTTARPGAESSGDVIVGAEDGPARTASQGPSSNRDAPPTPDQLKHALKKFKKRLKFTRMDDESKLGHRATSSGRKSAIVAIMPPREFPPSVWEELAKQGKIRNSGGGFYELVGE